MGGTFWMSLVALLGVAWLARANQCSISLQSVEVESQPPSQSPDGEKQKTAGSNTLFLEEVAVELADPAHHHWSCIDGSSTQPVFGTPGGDAGEFLLGLSVFRALGGDVSTPRRVEQLFELFMRTVSRERTFYLHSDARTFERIKQAVRGRAESGYFGGGGGSSNNGNGNTNGNGIGNGATPAGGGGSNPDFNLLSVPRYHQELFLQYLTDANFVGCSHLRLAMLHPEEYQTPTLLTQSLIAAFFNYVWNHPQRALARVDFEVLPGMHREQGLMRVDTQHRAHKNASVTCISELLRTFPMIRPYVPSSTVSRHPAAEHLIDIPQAETVAPTAAERAARIRRASTVNTVGQRVPAPLLVPAPPAAVNITTFFVVHGRPVVDALRTHIAGFFTNQLLLQQQSSNAGRRSWSHRDDNEEGDGRAASTDSDGDSDSDRDGSDRNSDTERGSRERGSGGGRGAAAIAAAATIAAATPVDSGMESGGTESSSMESSMEGSMAAEWPSDLAVDTNALLLPSVELSADPVQRRRSHHPSNEPRTPPQPALPFPVDSDNVDRLQLEFERLMHELAHRQLNLTVSYLGATKLPAVEVDITLQGFRSWTGRGARGFAFFRHHYVWAVSVLALVSMCMVALGVYACKPDALFHNLSLASLYHRPPLSRGGSSAVSVASVGGASAASAVFGAAPHRLRAGASAGGVDGRGSGSDSGGRRGGSFNGDARESVHTPLTAGSVSSSASTAGGYGSTGQSRVLGGGVHSGATPGVGEPPSRSTLGLSVGGGGTNDRGLGLAVPPGRDRDRVRDRGRGSDSDGAALSVLKRTGLSGASTSANNANANGVGSKDGNSSSSSSSRGSRGSGGGGGGSAKVGMNPNSGGGRNPSSASAPMPATARPLAGSPAMPFSQASSYDELHSAPGSLAESKPGSAMDSYQNPILGLGDDRTTFRSGVGER